MKLKFLCCLVAVGQVCIAQLASDPYKFIAKYDPPKSPNASSFERYTSIPGNYQTGQFAYSIPLMSFTDDGVTIPLTLEYSSTGLKAQDVASWIGLGWNLNIGGVITREVRGIPDDADYGLMGAQAANNLDRVIRGQMTGLERWNFFKSVTQHLGDVEHDIFHYQVLGMSGSFYINKYGVCVQMPRTNRIIQFTKDFNGRLDKFSITDEKNNKYSFDLKEESTITSITNTVTGNDPNYYPRLKGTSWYLTHIVTQNGDDIALEYDHYQYNKTEKSETNTVYTHTGLPDECGSAISYRGTHIHTLVDVYQLNTIYWKNGAIVFDKGSNRTDLTQIDASAAVPCLAGMTLYKLAPPFYQGYSAVQKVSFDYLQGPRLFLKAVNFKDLDGLVNNKFQFNYINETTSASYWPSYNYMQTAYNAQDYWGFFNGNLSNPDMIPYDVIPNYPNIDGLEYNTQYNATLGILRNRNNRVPNPNFSAYGMLQEIYYPTGGKTKIYYEGNIVRKSNVSYAISGTDMLVNTLPQSTDAQGNALVTLGGLRVKKLEFYADPNAAAPSTKTNIVYDQAGISTKFLPSFITTMEKDNRVNTDGLCVPCNNKYMFTLYSNSVVPNPAYLVEYSKVTEYTGDTNDAGQTVHYYRPSEIGPGMYWACPHTVPFYYSWHTGEAMTSTQLPNGIAVQEKSATNMANDTILGWAQLIDHFDADLRLATFRVDECYTSPFSPQYSPQNNSEADQAIQGVYKWETVFLPTENYVTTKVTQTNMDNTGQSLQNIVNYSFVPSQANKLLPSGSSSSNSRGEATRAFITYPGDYFSGPPATTSDPVVNGLVYQMNHNLLNLPVEVLQTVTQGGTEYVTSGQLYMYLSYALAVDRIYQFTASVPIPLASFTRSRISSSGYFSMDSHYELAKQFYTYNALNQPLEYSEGISGFRHALIWDYQSSYQIADVINAGQSDIAYTSFEANGTGNWSVGSTARLTGSAVTGITYFSLNSNISRSGLNSGRTYIVSYWTTGSTPFSIAGTLPGYPVKGKVANVSGNLWTYYEHKVTGQGTISLSGSGAIDELRLYPDGAQMMTYTYAPLVGISSQCDAGSKLSYYFYDRMNRLQAVKDADGEILKTIDYHYKGQ